MLPKMKQRVKLLSSYLVLASVLQVCMYAAWSFSPKKLLVIFYFDPRIGLFAIESGIRGTELPGILQWLSAIGLLLISLLLFSGRPFLKTYIISEIVASIPNLFFFVVVVLANLSPVHGFSVGELLVPVLVMIFFTVVPLMAAVRIWQKSLQEVRAIPPHAEQALGADSPLSGLLS